MTEPRQFLELWNLFTLLISGTLLHITRMTKFKMKFLSGHNFASLFKPVYTSFILHQPPISQHRSTYQICLHITSMFPNLSPINPHPLGRFLKLLSHPRSISKPHRHTHKHTYTYTRISILITCTATCPSPNHTRISDISLNNSHAPRLSLINSHTLIFVHVTPMPLTRIVTIITFPNPSPILLWTFHLSLKRPKFVTDRLKRHLIFLRLSMYTF